MMKKIKKVLIIDDEGDLIEMLSIRLKAEGFEVDSALEGMSGLEKVVTFQPDCILLDISMPGISGWEVCQRLKQNQETADINIFIISATRDLKPAKDCGADRVILKPFNSEEILTALK